LHTRVKRDLRRSKRDLLTLAYLRAETSKVLTGVRVKRVSKETY
jgi:hypothetical protein